MNSAIIVAGGVGSRTISKVPKQFVRINTNNRILSFSVQAFKKNKNIDEVVIVVHKDWLDIINREFLNCKVVEGGKTRYDSSYQGLISCSSNCKNVLIHDAARPFISQIIIDTGFSSIDEFDAGIPIIDNRDSLLRLKENDIKYVDRKNIKVIQIKIYHKLFILYYKYLNIKILIQPNF